MNTIAPPATYDAAVAASVEGDVFPAPAATASRSPEPLRFARIVVPVDFSEHSLKAFQKALAFGQQFQAELVMVHILEQIVYPGDWMYPPMAISDFASGKREAIAKQLKALTAGSGVRTREIVRLGRAWQEVVEIAKETKADLVIIATHGYTGLRHVLLGSVAEKIVRHAPCPVLTVRADDRDFS